MYIWTLWAALINYKALLKLFKLDIMYYNKSK